MKRITARDNPRYQALKRLCQSSGERRRSGLAVLDGMHLIEAYHQCHGPPPELLVSDSGVQRPEVATYLKQADTRTTVLADALFASLAVVDTPSGVMAVVAQRRPAAAPDPTVDTVLLDGIQDPGNVGSILRTSAAAGFDQVLLAADCAQAWAPKTLRAAMGAHFRLDIHEGGDLPGFLATFHGLTLATLPTAATSLYQAPLEGPLAWIFGSEGNGVSAPVAAMATRHLRIPLAAGTESLNVAAAAAVCLFETVRRRIRGSEVTSAGGQAARGWL